MLTPIGVLGGIRGVFFANIGGAGFPQENYKFAVERHDHRRADRRLRVRPLTASPSCRSTARRRRVGLPPADGRASYGIGLESFLLGFPIHFDYVWRTLFNKDWEDLIFSAAGGSKEFRNGQFQVWIGYDF